MSPDPSTPDPEKSHNCNRFLPEKLPAVHVLAELHAAPEWLWTALVGWLLEGKRTVEQARAQAQRLAKLDEPPAWADAAAIARELAMGTMRPGDVGAIAKAASDARKRVELARHETAAYLAKLDQALAEGRPASRSRVVEIARAVIEEQFEAKRRIEAEELMRLRHEEAALREIAELRRYVSLERWNELSPEARGVLLPPDPDACERTSFNKQDNADIEWAQWSWNPVTGCLHDCPYCYARDIAQQKRMAPFYPNGFAPTLRPDHLLAPRYSKPPKEAEHDTRYRNVFVCSMADLFGRWVPEEWIKAVLAEIAAAPLWNFLCLTKFPKRMAEFDLPANAWMGTTVDLQARVAAAEAGFAKVRSGVRWLSIEPMLEPLRFKRLDLFQWMVIGGSSASSKTPEWRPPFDWIVDLVKQAREAGVKVYFKTNLLGNRILELPFDAPIKADPVEAPAVFHYLGGRKEA